LLAKATGFDFFDRRREWSRLKHEILRRYLPKFAAILGSVHPTVYYVDGFAGAGTYEQDGDGPPVPGSPLIAAALATTMGATQKRAYGLRCINVEPKARYSGELCQATAVYANGVVGNLRGTFKQRLPEILESVRTYPTLFFLDPFGYKGMEWDAMLQLAQRATREQAKTELLINFNVSKIDRGGGWLDSYGQPAAPSFLQGLNQLYGTNAWQEIENSGLPVEERNDKLTELYMDRLSQAFHGIVASYPVRTIDGRLKYYLLHLTRHRRGCREMSYVIRKVDDAYIAERARLEASKPLHLGLGGAFDPPPPPDPREQEAELIGRLAADIYRVGKKRGGLTFGGVQDALAVKWFAQADVPHFRHACALLIRQGRIDHPKEKGLEEKTFLRFV
jgi:three-Cys-motif partner protein